MVYPSSKYLWNERLTMSKFLWKIGCASVWKLRVALASPAVCNPNCILRRLSASCMNSSQGTNFACIRSALANDSSSATTGSSSQMAPMRSRDQFKSWTANNVSLGSEPNKQPPDAFFLLTSETIWMESSLSLDNCVSTSNVRIVSISSPKKSMRYGYSYEKEKTSKILPRSAYCPGSYT